MNKEQWDKLPIGTILIQKINYIFIDVKISEDETLCVGDLEPIIDMVGFIEPTIKLCKYGFYKVAPKWIQDMFVIDTKKRLRRNKMYRKGTKENKEFKKELRERIKVLESQSKVKGKILSGTLDGVRESIERTVA